MSRGALVLALLAAGCTKAPTGSITGTVHLEGERSHAGVTVLLSGPVGGAAQTDDSGAYTFDKVPPGSYALTALAPSTVEGSVTAGVQVAGSAVSAPELDLSPLGDLAGKVTLEGTSQAGGVLVTASQSGVVALTAPDGSYILHGVPTGAHDVTATQVGFQSATASAVQVTWHKKAAVPDLGLARLVAGRGGVAGHVRVEGGAKLSGIAVLLAGPVSTGTVTDEGGGYAFGQLPAGTYALTLVASGTLEGTQVRAVAVAGSDVASAPDVSFTAAGELAGTATIGAATNGNAGIVVAVAGADGVAVTDDAGHYRLRQVPAGKRTLVASKPGLLSATLADVEVTQGQSAAAPALVLQTPTQPAGTLSGKALLQGQPSSAGIAITLVGPDVTSVAQTDAAGSYTFSNLPDGLYTLTAAAPSTLERTQSWQATVANGAAATSPDVTFQPAGELSGTVTLAGKTTGLGGTAVSVPGQPAVAFTDDAGHFLLKALPAGALTLAVAHQGYVSRLVPDVQVTFKGTAAVPTIDLAVGDSASASPPRTLTGVATLVGRSDHSGTTVTIDGTSVSATTRADGSYQLSGVPDGIFSLSFKNGPYEESVTVLQNGPTAQYLAADGALYPLPSIELERGKRVFSDPNPINNAPLAPVVVAPDGSKVLFRAGGSTYASLYQYNAGTGAVARVSGASWYYAYSADSSELVYRLVDNSLWAAPAGASTPQPVRLAGNVSRFVVSDDGRYVAYATFDNALSVIPSGGGTPVTLLPAAAGQYIVDYRFTGDSKRVAFAYAGPTTGGAYVLAVELVTGGTPVTISQQEGRAPAFQTSPDGSTVVFVGGEGYVHVANVTGTSASVINNSFCQTVTDTNWVRYTPDGSRILMASGCGIGSVLSSVRSDGTGAVVLSNNAAVQGALQTSADGTKVVFLNRATNALTVGNVATGALIAIYPLPSGLYVFDPRLSANGAMVLFGMNVPVMYSLYAMPAGGGIAVLLSQDASISDALITPDGTKAVFTGIGGSDQRTLHAVSTSDPRQDTVFGPPNAVGPLLSGETGMSLSPDGKRVLFRTLDETLYVGNLSDGTSTALMTRGVGHRLLGNGRAWALRTEAPVGAGFQTGFYSLLLP